MQRRFVAETAGYRHFAGRCDNLWNSNTASESDATRGEALNLAGAGSISIRELASLVLELLGLEGKTQVSYTSKSWQGDISLLLPDIAKARRLLGYNPEVALKDGVGALIRWLEARKGWQLSALRSR